MSEAYGDGMEPMQPVYTGRPMRVRNPRTTHRYVLDTAVSLLATGVILWPPNHWYSLVAAVSPWLGQWYWFRRDVRRYDRYMRQVTGRA